MHQRPGGVDLHCAFDGKDHMYRLRFCLDAKRCVRLMGTGVVGTRPVSFEVTPRGIRGRQGRCLNKCLLNSQSELACEAMRFVHAFPPASRAMLSLKHLDGVMRYIHGIR